MIDFIFGKEIAIEKLEKMVQYARVAKNFTMRTFIHHDFCGTHGCLVGTYCLKENLLHENYAGKLRPIRNGTFHEFAEGEFGITRAENYYLFQYLPHKSKLQYRDACILDKGTAIARLQKFVAYKKRKAEIFADYERARRQESNWFVCRTVQQVLATQQEGKVAV